MEQQRKRYKTPERANLSADNVLLIDGWLNQLNGQLNAVKLTRSDIVNWILKQRKPDLPDREIVSIEKEYFDPVKALEAAVVEAKKRQNRGDELDIAILINEKILRKKPRGRKKQRPKSDIKSVSKPLLE